MIRRVLAALAWLFDRPAPHRPAVDDTVFDIPACPGDPSPQQLVELQGLCLQWLVMWCWYRREYMAIARFDTATPILFDAHPQRLVYACRTAELAVVV
ncbi:hypothetical protein [Actinoallomurus rhizosphaericola]|uniref:hypothetical protein n=1 Tax=Actinoallomurus rhizosphaericola TaxID=2952536 RepID=UPI002090BC37|nr:hypothetical protein [Actinoallomurus rhizosphaericola]MCO5994186.1 hypothetical protein [Actinoallomurus rhizosphaericola]